MEDAVSFLLEKRNKTSWVIKTLLGSLENVNDTTLCRSQII